MTKEGSQAASGADRYVALSAAAARRLKAAVAAVGKQDEVAKLVGISRQSLAAIVNGRAQPRMRSFLALCRVVGLEPAAVLGEDDASEWVAPLSTAFEVSEPAGRKFARDVRRAFHPEPSSSPSAHELEQVFNNLTPIPMDDVFASAGPGILALEARRTNYFIGFPKPWLSKVFGNHDQLRLVGIKGDSMEPTLSDGDLAMIDLARREPSDGVYALVLDGMLLVKRLALAGPGFVRVISDNKLSDGPRDIDVEAEADNFRVVGRVVWAGGKL